MVGSRISENASGAAGDKAARIIGAAIAVFAEKGFHGSTVPEVASLAAVGTGTIYRYFESKEQLVNAAFRDAKLELKEYLVRDIGLTVHAATEELFAQFWRNIMAFADEHPAAFRFLELQDHALYLDTSSKNVELEVLAPIWLALEQSRRDGLVGNLRADVSMALVWGAFVGLRKAGALGYVSLSQQDWEDARRACWGMLTSN